MNNVNNRKMFAKRDARNKLAEMGGILASSPELLGEAQKFANGGSTYVPNQFPEPNRRRLEDSAFRQYGMNLNADNTLSPVARAPSTSIPVKTLEERGFNQREREEILSIATNMASMGVNFDEAIERAVSMFESNNSQLTASSIENDAGLPAIKQTLDSLNNQAGPNSFAEAGIMQFTDPRQSTPIPGMGDLNMTDSASLRAGVVRPDMMPPGFTPKMPFENPSFFDVVGDKGISPTLGAPMDPVVGLGTEVDPNLKYSLPSEEMMSSPISEPTFDQLTSNARPMTMNMGRVSDTLGAPMDPVVGFGTEVDPNLKYSLPTTEEKIENTLTNTYLDAIETDPNKLADQRRFESVNSQVPDMIGPNAPNVNEDAAIAVESAVEGGPFASDSEFRKFSEASGVAAEKKDIKKNEVAVIEKQYDNILENTKNLLGENGDEEINLNFFEPPPGGSLDAPKKTGGLKARNKEMQALYQEMFGEDEKEVAAAKWNQLAMVGFAIAAGKDPNALTNIAAGLLAGAKQTKADKDRRAARKDKIKMSAFESAIRQDAAEASNENKIAAATLAFTRSKELKEIELGLKSGARKFKSPIDAYQAVYNAALGSDNFKIKMLETEELEKWANEQAEKMLIKSYTEEELKGTAFKNLYGADTDKKLKLGSNSNDGFGSLTVVN